MAKTVLIADDISFVRNTLSDILQGGHYQIVGEASDGKQVIDLYRKVRPDFVTMDLAMPEMNGIEAVRKILEFDKAAKVIIISAMGQESLVMEAIHAGAKDYILKPFSANTVLKTIERVLQDGRDPL